MSDTPGQSDDDFMREADEMMKKEVERQAAERAKQIAKEHRDGGERNPGT